jgi:hypothetical protein
MAASKKTKRHLNEDGQAIFEVLVFLPLLIFLYTVLYNVGNSINISINQQKATRRYFYYLIKGNSYLPSQEDLATFRASYTRVGMSVIGFKDKAEGGVNGSPIAPCFRFNSFLTGANDETCEESSEGERATSFVRVFTAYGICGDTYSLQDGHWRSMYEQGDGSPDPRSNPSNCSIGTQ